STTPPVVSESMLFFDGANTLTYTPAPDFEGSDNFTYTASDGIYSDTRTVILNVSVSDSSNGGAFNLFYLVNVFGLLIALRNSYYRNIKSRKNMS
ncbi:MAG: hypothetical protein KAU21_10690, partial [Gammaproteobacteria bacterium]|nr:hypothetical protein [Gammaproteobacteria bacterium]